MSVVWLNGPVGAGKSTLAYAVRALVHPVSAVVLLDEDAVRQAISDATSELDSDVAAAMGRLCGMARVLAQQGFVVVVAASDTASSVLLWNRANLPGYREVYLRASSDTIKHRNRRRRPNDGSAPPPPTSLPQPAMLRPNSAPPPDPDLTIDMDNPEPPELLAFRVAVLIPEYVVAAAGAAGFDTHRLRRGA
jgi:energy-coupling factor transporter ATP-binding protein EcfA2